MSKPFHKSMGNISWASIECLLLPQKGKECADKFCMEV